MGQGRPYHHGDLRNALIDATMELVRERGARGFSVSEAARRAGVSISAPYRHFADRDSMLAAAAMLGFRELEARFDTLLAGQSFGDHAAQIAVSYLRFALEYPARFEVMFAPGIDRLRHPEMLGQAERVQQRLEDTLAPYLDGEPLAERAAQLWALAHGVATLAVEGALQHFIGDQHYERIAENAARAWSAGVQPTPPGGT
ncbi:hypothetical protein Val02_04790 [Virgisporangium aliadipatigenens]|uniref:HTH tetR-type domain-containing protein n=1 Tax=Virgisporangium aliadipatigenens TaxID=741659 RepID=A0A8J3YG38_9ACTN|nr:TetR/AcrR family transcriptional regulator [Virgisporangium aliadipatigenens]GIJ43593.1 hypothetical protein Val02_04790 [Virgisporangium aliadipatigenens]